MKRKLVYIFIAIVLLLVIFMLIRYISGAKTIHEALHVPHHEYIDIIHQENIQHGIIVFYHLIEHDSQSHDNISVSFVKKRFGNYKEIYSTVQGDIDTMIERFGFTFTYQPAFKKISPPLYFGLVDNPEIAQIKIVELESQAEKLATMVQGSDETLWFLDMTELKGTDYQIIALSKDNKEIAIREDHVPMINENH